MFRVLAIEDNEADIYLLRLALTEAKLDFDLDVIGDGAAAISFIREKQEAGGPKLDLVVLDLNLPHVGGLDVLKALRKNPHYFRLPVVILTSSSAAKEKAKARELGATHFLSKGTNLQEFLRIGGRLRDILQGRKPVLA